MANMLDVLHASFASVVFMCDPMDAGAREMLVMQQNPWINCLLFFKKALAGFDSQSGLARQEPLEV